MKTLRIVTRELQTPLAESDLDNLRERHTDLCLRARQMKAELDEYAHPVKAEIKLVKKESDQVLGTIENACELRPIECREVLDDTEIRVIRLDTEEVVESRVATEVEIKAGGSL